MLDRLRLLDPGRIRLRTAARTILAALAALLITAAICKAAGLPGAVVVIATVVTVTLARTLHGTSLAHRLSALLYVPAIGVLAAFVGRFMLHHTWLGSAMYVAAIAASRYLMRFGGTVRRLGRLALAPLISVMVVPIPPSAAQAAGPLWGAAASAVAVACLLLAQAVLPARPAREAATAALDLTRAARHLPSPRALTALHTAARTTAARLAAAHPLPPRHPAATPEPASEAPQPPPPPAPPAEDAQPHLLRRLRPHSAGPPEAEAAQPPQSPAPSPATPAEDGPAAPQSLPPQDAATAPAQDASVGAPSCRPATASAPASFAALSAAVLRAEALAYASVRPALPRPPGVASQPPDGPARPSEGPAAPHPADSATAPSTAATRPPEQRTADPAGETTAAPGAAAASDTAPDPVTGAPRCVDAAPPPEPASATRSPAPDTAPESAALTRALDDLTAAAAAVRRVRARELPTPEAPRAARGARKGPQPQTRLTAQLAAAMGAAFAAGHLLFPHHWTWTVITAFVVCSAARSRGDVVHRSGLRIGGAFAGAVTGTLAAHLVAGSPPFGVAVIFCYLFVGLWLRDVNYAVWAFCVTSLLAVMYSLNGEHDTAALLLQRPEGILLGSACGILAAYFVLPLRTETVMRGRAARALQVVQDLLAALREPAPDPAALRELARAADLAAGDLATAASSARAHRALVHRHRRMAAPHAADWADTLALCVREARALAALPPADLAAARAPLGLTARNVAQVRRRLGHRPDAQPPRPVGAPALLRPLNDALATLYGQLPAPPAPPQAPRGRHPDPAPAPTAAP